MNFVNAILGYLICLRQHLMGHCLPQADCEQVVAFRPKKEKEDNSSFLSGFGSVLDYLSRAALVLIDQCQVENAETSMRVTTAIRERRNIRLVFM